MSFVTSNQDTVTCCGQARFQQELGGHFPGQDTGSSQPGRPRKRLLQEISRREGGTGTPRLSQKHFIYIYFTLPLCPLSNHYPQLFCVPPPLLFLLFFSLFFPPLVYLPCLLYLCRAPPTRLIPPCPIYLNSLVHLVKVLYLHIHNNSYYSRAICIHSSAPVDR